MRMRDSGGGAKAKNGYSGGGAVCTVRESSGRWFLARAESQKTGEVPLE